jgi:hypothetical protein
LAAVAALGHVMRDAGDDDAGEAGHGKAIPKRALRGLSSIVSPELFSTSITPRGVTPEEIPGFYYAVEPVRRLVV